jgi:uncharacterized membrane protein
VLPPPTVYHRLLGWHAPDLRRTLTMAVIGVATGLAVSVAVDSVSAVLIGWDAAAISYLLTTWPIIVRADSAQTRKIAQREDPTRTSARLLLLAASVASLLGVGGALRLAGRHHGAGQILLITLAVATVVLSWALINTTYTLRYAHLQFEQSDAGIDFPDADQPSPRYRDFAYVAFTIGMCYQVSDTALRDSYTRRTALSHALLSYLFGVVIVAGAINLIAGLLH